MTLFGQAQIERGEFTGVPDSKKAHDLLSLAVDPSLINGVRIASTRIGLGQRMFLIRTRIGPSKIHGTGDIACETAEQGTVIWKFEPLFDREDLETVLALLLAGFREFVELVAYRGADLGGRLIISADLARFLILSDDRN